MKKFFNKFIISLVLLCYVVGSCGFTIHHCCCNKLYHTSSILVSVFAPYHVHNCLKVIEAQQSKGKLVFKQNRHCGDYSYAMSHLKYTSQESQSSFDANLLLVHSTPILAQIGEVREGNPTFNHTWIEHKFRHRWQDFKYLCIFRI